MDEKERKDHQEKLEDEKKMRQAACEHKTTKKEKIRGLDTGDSICKDCGKLI